MNRKTEHFIAFAEDEIKRREADIDADLRRALEDVQRLINDRALGRRTHSSELANVISTLHRAERHVIESSVAKGALENLKSVVIWESKS